MKVLHKNDGAYADYSLDGTVLSFRGGELTLDLAELERDYPVNITVSEDGAKKLTTGVSRRYVAEIDIPARISAVEKTGHEHWSQFLVFGSDTGRICSGVGCYDGFQDGVGQPGKHME